MPVTNQALQPGRLSLSSTWLREIEILNFYRFQFILGSIIKKFRPSLGPTQFDTERPLGAGFLPTGVKRPGRYSEHPPPSSDKVKNEWNYTSTPHTPSRRAWGQPYTPNFLPFAG
jgi:hypothetical protein